MATEAEEEHESRMKSEEIDRRYPHMAVESRQRDEQDKEGTSHEQEDDEETRSTHNHQMLRSPSSQSHSSTHSNNSSISSDDERLLDKVITAPKQRVSIYVQVFEEMMQTVLEHESHLFNQNELEMLERFQKMSYPARYLFVRLFSRKNGWFRVARLGYHDELVDVQAAVDEICNTTATISCAQAEASTSSTNLAEKNQSPDEVMGNSDNGNGPDVIDDRDASGGQSSSRNAAATAATAAPDPSRLLGKHRSSSSIICIESDDEALKTPLAGTNGSSGSNRLIQSSNTTKSIKNRSKTKDDNIKTGKLSDPLSNRSIAEIKKDTEDFGLTRFAINEQTLARKNDIDELLSLLSLDELKVLGKDLRIASHYTTRSVIIEAIRKTSSNQSTITSMFAVSAANAKAKAEAALLTITNGRRRLTSSLIGEGSKGTGKGKGKGKASDEVIPERKRPSRQTEVLIYKILQHLGSCIKLESGPIRLFARLHLLYYRSVQYSDKTLTQAVLARFKIRNYPSYEVKRSFSVFPNRQALVDYEDALILERRMEELLGEASDPYAANRFRKGTKEDKERDMREALAIFEEVYPRWKDMVEIEKRKDEESERERHEKGIKGDDKLTYYRKRFLAGWPLTRVVHKGSTILARLHEYDREVEVMTTLLGQSCFRRGKRGEWYDRLALLYMHHHSRLTKLEGMDKLQCQEKALEICYEGLRHPWTHLIYHNSLGRRIVRLETALDVPKEDRHPPVPTLRVATKRVIRGEKLSEGETGRKSIWRARDGDEVSVEHLCLQQYNREGWKAFHSENGILTTVFSLLFWDVIFAPIDGVFETAYQAGPLDLSTDAFSIVRAELVKERLDEIEAGKATELLTRTDDRERENRTYCVGLKWGYEREDLAEIIQCFTPKALRMICRVYAEEWSHRIGGVPDLFLWNFEEKKCRFVEVKGPGDFLSETQKVWIDVLLSADVSVELCSVVQIYEEDDLSLSEAESPRKVKRNKSACGTSASPVSDAKTKMKKSPNVSKTTALPKRERSSTEKALPIETVSKKRGSDTSVSAQPTFSNKLAGKEKSESKSKRPKLSSKERRAKAQSTGSVIILSD